MHFHPGRRFAREHLGLRFGKTESWIILEAEPDAAVHVGLREPVDPETVRGWVERQDAEEMLAALHRVPVAAGDAVLVPAGTLHAIGGGILLLELQEPTDLSVLVEWKRFGVDDGPEHLELGWETALRALDREPIDPAALKRRRPAPARGRPLLPRRVGARRRRARPLLRGPARHRGRGRARRAPADPRDDRARAVRGGSDHADGGRRGDPLPAALPHGRRGGLVTDQPLLEARKIVKSFGRVQALTGANFTVYPKEVVALVGDNGAGKSTLVKTLVGVHPPDSGEILFEGEPVDIHTPQQARAIGIETVYQDLALAAEIDPAANMFLGREIMRGGPLGKLGFLDKAAMRTRSEEAFRDLGVRIQDTTAPVANMSGGQRQGIAISRAVTWASKVVFMDEPTAALGVVQTRNVLDQIKRVRDQGLAVVLISHNLPEIFEVADRIEVLRLGERVARLRPSEVSMEDVVSAMTGALTFHEES